MVMANMCLCMALLPGGAETLEAVEELMVVQPLRAPRGSEL